MVMANLFLRLSLSFACMPVKLAVGRKREIILAYIVGEVHFKGARIRFSLKYKQKTKKDEPEKTKKELRLSSSFRVRLSLLSARISTKNEFLFLLNESIRQRERKPTSFSFFQHVWLNYKQKTKKVEERGLPSLIENTVKNGSGSELSFFGSFRMDKKICLSKNTYNFALKNVQDLNLQCNTFNFCHYLKPYINK